MFDAFSMRARQVLFAARLKAGERGGTSIDVDVFLLGLVLEDQGMLGQNLLPNLLGQVGTPIDEGTSHIPLFSVEAAKNLVTTIEAHSTSATAVSLATEIPLATALERAFCVAKELQIKLHSTQIEPLHLVAAILADASSQCGKLLQEHGITQEKVLERLRDTTHS